MYNICPICEIPQKIKNFSTAFHKLHEVSPHATPHKMQNIFLDYNGCCLLYL